MVHTNQDAHDIFFREHHSRACESLHLLETNRQIIRRAAEDDPGRAGLLIQCCPANADRRR